MASRRERLRSSTIDEIKAIARQQMAAQGAVNISLRGIARDMGMTVTALYRYFASYDDLLTALILDAFNELADSMEAAQAAHTNTSSKLWHALAAYRDYAIQHPHEFSLIYGTPIPNYHAPAELTVPATVRTQVLVAGLVEQGIQDGSIRPTPIDSATPQYAHYRRLVDQGGYPVSPEALDIVARLWIRGHGIIMLEMFGHLKPAVGDVNAFFQHELMDAFLHLGISPP